MKQNKKVLRPPMTGPCSASPVHSSLGRSASNRPYTGGVAGTVRSSSRRTKWRCSVRSDGAQPDWARRILATCAAVRSGRSRLSAAAKASTSAGVRGCTRAGVGTSASNPPARHQRTHRSIVCRDTRTCSPNGP